MGRRNPPSAQETWVEVFSLPCPKALHGFSRKYPGSKESISLASNFRGPLREGLSHQQGIGSAWLQVGLQKAFPVTGPTHMQLWVIPHHRTVECWSLGHFPSVLSPGCS